METVTHKVCETESLEAFKNHILNIIRQTLNTIFDINGFDLTHVFPHCPYMGKYWSEKIVILACFTKSLFSS